MDSPTSQSTNPHGRGQGRGRGDTRGRGRGRGQNQDPSFRGRGRGRGQDSNPSYRGRGRGDSQSRAQGRGCHPPRAHFRDPNDSRPVPSFSSIHPSTPVRIILKQDQPTGRTVTGIVADLLTRGDHPRGVKVRLRDGRVGRVQSLVSQEDGEAGESSVGGPDSNLGRNGEGYNASSFTRGGRSRGGRIERDIRSEDEYLYDGTKGTERANEGWFAALEAADRKHEAKKTGKMVDEGGYEVVECPVCRVFRGDERAVQHHVETHYHDYYK